MAEGTVRGRFDRSSQLELLVRSVTDYAVFMLDPEGRVATWNRGAEKIKGYAPEEIVSEHFSRFYTEADKARGHPQEVLAAAHAAGRYEEEGWRVRKDGSRFWASVVVTAVRDDAGRLLGFGKVTRDLTAQRLGFEQLRASEAELRAANEQLVQFRRMVAGVRDYAIFMLDAGGAIASWNTGAEHIKGYAAEEVLGRHFSMFYTAQDRARGHPAHELELAARDGHYEEEGWRVRKDGSLFWASVTITAIRNEQGTLTGYSKVTRDLTERRKGEERLRAAQDDLRRSNAELERFAVVAAHDLREPLMTIGSFVQLVTETEGDRLSADGRLALERTSEAVSDMQELVEDLLLYARLGTVAVTLESVPLHAAARRVLDRLGAAISRRGARIDVDLPEDAAVLVDRMGADVLLQNFVSNAIKFGDPRGPHVAITARAEDGGWTVAVRDDGPGIAAADQDRIFAAFERVRGPAAQPGQGLGLSICRRVADRSGGRLGVESAQGEGSRFWCWLPAGARP